MEGDNPHFCGILLPEQREEFCRDTSTGEGSDGEHNDMDRCRNGNMVADSGFYSWRRDVVQQLRRIFSKLCTTVLPGNVLAAVLTRDCVLYPEGEGSSDDGTEVEITLLGISELWSDEIPARADIKFISRRPTPGATQCLQGTGPEVPNVKSKGELRLILPDETEVTDLSERTSRNIWWTWT